MKSVWSKLISAWLDYLVGMATEAGDHPGFSVAVYFLVRKNRYT